MRVTFLIDKAQVVSAILWLFRKVPGSTPLHAYNPLEQRWLFLGHAAMRRLDEHLTSEAQQKWFKELGCGVDALAATNAGQDVMDCYKTYW